ncbi:MAG: NfeD family protein [Lachnospiraceae bacterium]|jgi:membrane protein implicated in regulation of membrane protease activity|nr:NfeD family protein [Lachnospiraceae bacterium]MEE3461647.1 NfeD family protein [Lachnospiraceae bacterium]
MEPYYWLILLAIFVIADIFTTALVTIWFAGGALIAFIAALLGCPVPGQIIIFLVISIVLLIFTRPIAVKHFNAKREKTNIDRIAGSNVRVTERIDNFKQTGKVIYNGMEWTARSIDQDRTYEPGENVGVDRIEGVKLMVKGPFNEDD